MTQIRGSDFASKAVLSERFIIKRMAANSESKRLNSNRVNGVVADNQSVESIVSLEEVNAPLQTEHDERLNTSRGLIESTAQKEELKIAGAIYKGPLKDNKPHGRGELVIDGQKYEGDWQDGCLEKVKPLN